MEKKKAWFCGERKHRASLAPACELDLLINPTGSSKPGWRDDAGALPNDQPRATGQCQQRDSVSLC